MSYDDSLPTTRDHVRFLIDDTNEASPIFSDNELDALIAHYGDDPHLVAYYALMAMASNRSRLAIKIKSGGPSGMDVDKTKLAKELRDTAKEYLAEYKRKPAATEVHLEDKNVTYLEGLGDQRYNFDTDPNDMNQ